MSESSTRYTILLDGPTVASLNELQATCGLGTRAAVFDLSLVVLEWIVKQQLAGYEVGRSKGDSFQPMLLPVRLRVPDDTGVPGQGTASNTAVPLPTSQLAAMAG